VTGIKSIPYVPLSHPFLERLIGTIRREYWITRCSEQRQISKTSCSISGPTSTTIARISHWKGGTPETPVSRPVANLGSFRWQPHCRNPKSDTSGCVTFQDSRSLRIRSTLGKFQNFQLNHLLFAFLVAARFADPIVSLPSYQFARDRLSPWVPASSPSSSKLPFRD